MEMMKTIQKQLNAKISTNAIDGLKTKRLIDMTPTFPDDYKYTELQYDLDQVKFIKGADELKRKVCEFLDQKGILTPQTRLELIKLIIEDEESFK
jgi:hypothetical protein